MIFVLIALILLVIIGCIAASDTMGAGNCMVGSIIVSLLLALATGIFVNYWSEGIVGLPGNFDSNAYYEVVGTGKPCDSFTPVLLKRPDNSVRSVWFSGTVTNIPDGTLCKIVGGRNNDGQYDYTLEPLH